MQQPSHHCDNASLCPAKAFGESGIKGNEKNWLARSPIYRMNAWFSLIPAILSKDSHFTLWRQFLRWLAKALLGNQPFSDEAAESAAQAAINEANKSEGGVSKSDHKEQMKRLRAAHSNSLLLSSAVTHNYNFFYMRLALRVGKFWWKMQGDLAQTKKTPEEEVRHRSEMACGKGREYLKKVWREVVTDSRELARLGLKTTSDSSPQDFGPEIDSYTGLRHPGIEAESIAQRIMGFLCYNMESFFWFFANQEEIWPAAFAGLLHKSAAKHSQTLARAQEVWETMLAIEGQSKSYPSLQFLRLKVYFLHWPTVQLRFRILDQIRFTFSSDHGQHVRDWFRRSKKRIGDSVPIEKSNKAARKTETNGASNEMHGQTILHVIRQPEHNAVEERGIPHVKVRAGDWDINWKPTRSWRSKVTPDTSMPASWKVDNVLKNNKPFKSPNTQSKRHAIAALNAMLYFCRTSTPRDADYSWQTCTVMPQLLIHSPQDKLFYFVMAVAADASVVWKADTIRDGEEWGLDLDETWKWLPIVHIEKWQMVPVIWKARDILSERHGFITLRRDGEAIPLVVSALCRMVRRPVMYLRHKLIICYSALELIPVQPKSAPLLDKEQTLIKTLLADKPELADKYLAENRAVHKMIAEAAAKRRKTKENKGSDQQEAGDDTEAEQEEEDAVNDEMPEEIEEYFYAALDNMEAADLPLNEQRRFKGPGNLEARAKRKAKQMIEKMQSKLAPAKAPASAEKPSSSAAEHPEAKHKHPAPKKSATSTVRRSNVSWIKAFVPPDESCKCEITSANDAFVGRYLESI